MKKPTTKEQDLMTAVTEAVEEGGEGECELSPIQAIIQALGRVIDDGVDPSERMSVVQLKALIEEVMPDTAKERAKFVETTKRIKNAAEIIAGHTYEMQFRPLK